LRGSIGAADSLLLLQLRKAPSNNTAVEQKHSYKVKQIYAEQCQPKAGDRKEKQQSRIKEAEGGTGRRETR